jgi:hypothetical protein
MTLSGRRFIGNRGLVVTPEIPGQKQSFNFGAVWTGTDWGNVSIRGVKQIAQKF